MTSEYERNRQQSLSLNTQGRANDLTRRSNQASALRFGDTTLPSPTSPGNLGQTVIDKSNNLFTKFDSSTTFAGAQPYVPLISKYFGKNDVAKTIWTGHWESGFKSERADAPGSDGATGILRIQNLPGRPSIDTLMDPENNIKYGSWLAYGSQGRWEDWRGPQHGEKADFTPWGDNGATYTDPKTGEKKRFGALSVHPFPGDEAVKLPPSPLPPDYQQVIKVSSEISNGLRDTRLAIESEKREYITSTIESGSVNQAAVDKAQKDNPTMNLSQLHSTGAYAQAKAQMEKEANLKLDEFNQKIAQVITEEQRQGGFLFIAQTLDHGIADSETNIKSYDDLITYIKPLYKLATGDELPQFDDYQQKFLTRAIGTLSPYLNGSQERPMSEKQLVEFLTIAKNAQYPSKRRSIAGMSNREIRSALTTLPSSDNKLPAGMTEEGIRSYLASQNLLDPEQRKEIDKLKGTYKDLILKWGQQDNLYKAYKLGLQSPSNMDLLKNRSLSIGQFGLQMYEEFANNVTRPAAAWGVSSLASINEELGGIPFAISPYGATRNALDSMGINRDLSVPYVGNINPFSVDADPDELRAQIRRNRLDGQDWWHAGGNAWQEWDANGLVKFMAETAFDPTTYLGFGVYPKIFGKVRYLGDAIGAVENGWKAAFDNPLISKVLFTGTVGGLVYQQTGELCNS
jgi:hypothetical protein